MKLPTAKNLLSSAAKVAAPYLPPALSARLLPRQKAATSSGGGSLTLRDMTHELGRGGLNVVGDYVYEEWLEELQGARGMAMYREMNDNCPTLGGINLTIGSLVRQVTWDAEAVKPDNPGFVSEQVHADDADFLRDNMTGMPEESWDEVIDDAMTMIPFGYALLEDCFYKRDDGRIGWLKMPGRAQESIERWNWDERGLATHAYQISPDTYDEIEIPLDKCTHFRTTGRKGNPEGRSCYRNAYPAHQFQKRLQVIEAIGIERDAAGIPKIGVPEDLFLPGATADQIAILNVFKSIATGIHRDEHEGLVMPIGYDDNGKDKYTFELVSSGGSRQININEVIVRYDWDKARAFMAKFVMLGQTAVGAKSLADTDTNLFFVILGAWLKNIQQTFNRQSVPRLFRLNGITDRPLPKVVSGDIESRDLGPVADALLKLVQAGMPVFPSKDNKTEDALMRMADVPWTPEGGLVN
jgi:hypothetical protein